MLQIPFRKQSSCTLKAEIVTDISVKLILPHEDTEVILWKEWDTRHLILFHLLTFMVGPPTVLIKRDKHFDSWHFKISGGGGGGGALMREPSFSSMCVRLSFTRSAIAGIKS